MKTLALIALTTGLALAGGCGTRTVIGAVPTGQAGTSGAAGVTGTAGSAGVAGSASPEVDAAAGAGGLTADGSIGAGDGPLPNGGEGRRLESARPLRPQCSPHRGRSAIHEPYGRHRNLERIFRKFPISVRLRRAEADIRSRCDRSRDAHGRDGWRRAAAAHGTDPGLAEGDRA